MSANAQTPGSGGLAAFDQLPPRLRQALANFPLCMSAEFALEKLRSGTSEARLLEMLEDNRKALGPVHPGAKG